MSHAQRARRPGDARVDNLDFRSCLGQSLGDGIGARVVGRDDDPLADEDRVTLEINERRVGGHHAGPVVVGHDERPLDRAGRDHDPVGRMRQSASGSGARRSQAQTRLPS
jgi:hypothetical protein